MLNHYKCFICNQFGAEVDRVVSVLKNRTNYPPTLAGGVSEIPKGCFSRLLKPLCVPRPPSPSCPEVRKLENF